MIKSIHRRYRGDITNYNKAPRNSQLYLVWTSNHVVSFTKKNCEKGKSPNFTKRCGNNNNLAPGPYPLGIKMSFFFKLAYCNWLSFYGFLSISQPMGLPRIPHNFPFIAFVSSSLCLLGGEHCTYRQYRLYLESRVSPLSINYSMY